MAETLSIEGDASSMLANKFEPKRKNLWVFVIDGIDAYLMRTAALPQKTFEEVTLDWINQKRYLAGKAAWNTLSVTLYDPISPSGTQQVLEWIRLTHEDVTGRQGFAEMYKRNTEIKQVDPMGTVVAHWILEGTWIQDCNWGDLDYSTADPVELSLTLRYDHAVNLF